MLKSTLKFANEIPVSPGGKSPAGITEDLCSQEDVGVEIVKEKNIHNDGSHSR